MIGGEDGVSHVNCALGVDWQTLQPFDRGRDFAPSPERRLITYGGSHFTILNYRIEGPTTVSTNDPGGYSRNQICLFQEKYPLVGGAVQSTP